MQDVNVNQTPAAAAPLYAEMLAALQAVGIDTVGVGGGENAISDAARSKVDAVLEKIGAPWPSPDTAAAAPVVLPEPFALYDGEKWYANEEAAICSCADMAKLQKVFTEQQLRALLATATGLPAQAVADEVHCVCGASWLRHGINDYEMTDTPRKARASGDANG